MGFISSRRGDSQHAACTNGCFNDRGAHSPTDDGPCLTMKTSVWGRGGRGGEGRERGGERGERGGRRGEGGRGGGEEEGKGSGQG